MNNQPHPHLSTTTSHHPNLQRRPEDGGARERWLEYHRFAARVAALERSNSAERKRRHPGQEHDRRIYPYPNHGGPSMTSRGPPTFETHSAPMGSSRETPVDLTTPPRPSAIVHRISGTDETTRARSRGSDIVLPSWQPDGEASRCPVCEAEFTFWYRKHHCRKCGRVVCSACSPHRITIPRQYIVQEPNALARSSLLDDDQSSPTLTNPALGGGEIVRVCNPCVPDPWTPDTLPTASTPGLPTEPVSVPGTSGLHPASTDDSYNSPDRAERRRQNSVLSTHPPTGGRHRSFSHQPAPPPYSSGPTRVALPMPNAMHAAASSSHGRGPPPLPPPPPPSPAMSRAASHRYSQSSSGVPPDPRRGSVAQNFRPQPNWRPLPPPFPESLRPPPVVPKRVIKEEDECPVCGVELPPNEQFRESHVQECIAARFSSGATSPPPASAGTPRTGDVASTHTYPAVRATPPTAASTAPTGRPRTTSYRPRGMAVYTATEKDCTNADDEAQECVICFEEFQPGDELGRMECLCKFHRVCIRSWWDRKGGGSCPTHQLQE